MNGSWDFYAHRWSVGGAFKHCCAPFPADALHKDKLDVNYSTLKNTFSVSSKPSLDCLHVVFKTATLKDTEGKTSHHKLLMSGRDISSYPMRTHSSVFRATSGRCVLSFGLLTLCWWSDELKEARVCLRWRNLTTDMFNNWLKFWFNK